jgi:NAD(P)-dependent dehydrogenase (short-subunit alcohol dehydrogenase family)
MDYIILYRTIIARIEINFGNIYMRISLPERIAHPIREKLLDKSRVFAYISYAGKQWSAFLARAIRPHMRNDLIVLNAQKRGNEVDMEHLTGKVAFITGAASGIGLGIAKACGRAGMKVVIADMRQAAIDEVLPFFQEKGWPVHGVRLDVTDREAYAKAADEAEAVFGKIHVLVNNAGVEVPFGPLWQSSFKDCDFIVSVNIIGILNGIITIVPRILKHGEGGHVVSTASQSGLSVVPGAALYCMTKAGVVGMMETLASDLKNTNVGASAFCPGPVVGNLKATTQEVRPEHLKNDASLTPPPAPPAPRGADEGTDIGKLFMTPEEAGERVVRGIRRGDLYILTHAEFKDGTRAKTEALLRAFPDQPQNEEFKKTFSFLTYNPVYESQTTPGGLDWD